MYFCKTKEGERGCSLRDPVFTHEDSGAGFPSKLLGAEVVQESDVPTLNPLWAAVSTPTVHIPLQEKNPDIQFLSLQSAEYWAERFLISSYETVAYQKGNFSLIPTPNNQGLFSVNVNI